MIGEQLFLRPVMTSSYLIQRLQAPYGHVNQFSFGCGLKNGGLSDDAFKILGSIMSFDYMGSAEFEWGAVPAAFRFLASQVPVPKEKGLKGIFKKEKGLKGIFKKEEKRDGLVSGEYIITGTSRAKEFLAVKGKVVFYICPTSYEEEVKKVIHQLATEKYGMHLKEHCGLHEALAKPEDDYASRNKGWLELDNGFMFFTDRKMFEDVKNLFGIKA